MWSEVDIFPFLLLIFLPCLPLSPEFAQTHAHWVGDTIQPSHPLSHPPPPALGLSHESIPVSLFSLDKGFFSMSQLFTSGGQSFGATALALSMNIQGWFPLGLIRLTSLQSKGFSRVFFSSTTIQKHHFFSLILLYGPGLTSIHDYWKNHVSDHTDREEAKSLVIL